jgi:pyridoxal phosphate enzyme (YggS family)
VDPAQLRSNLEAVRLRIAAACRRAGRSPQDVQIVAVTKTIAPALIECGFNLGLRDFGENRVQEALLKARELERLSPHASWHMIGHLQSNKVNSCLEVFAEVDSLDSVALARALDRRTTRKLPVLLQVNLAKEASKTGFSEQEFENAFQIIRRLPNLEIRGLMMVAPLVADPETVRPLFRQLKQIKDGTGLKELSMGMSDDFEVAIEEGATMVRIGRAIFGERL